MEPTSQFFPLLLAAGAVFIGAIFFFVGRHLRRDDRDLRAGLVTARAKILKKFRKPGGGTWGGFENYFIEVEFTDGSGALHGQELQVQSKAWRMLREDGFTPPSTTLPTDLKTLDLDQRWHTVSGSSLEPG